MQILAQSTEISTEYTVPQKLDFMPRQVYTRGQDG